MARFSNPAGSGDGADLPQGLAADSSPTFDKVYTTHNSDGTNVKIGDDAWIGDVDTANHIAIIGVEDDTHGGIILGVNETETIASDGTNLTLTADNDIILTPGSTYAYLNQVDVDHRIATMADITGGTDNHGNFSFVSDTLEVRDSLMNFKAYGADEVTLRGEVVLNPASDSSRFRVYDDQTQQSFSTSDWDTATWTSTGETSSQLVLTGASGVYSYFDLNLRDFNQAISINSNTPGKLDGWGSNGTDITIYILDMPVGTDTTVTTLDVYSAFASTILLDYDDNEMNFDAQNMHINMTTTGNRDINIISADDMTLHAAGDDMNIRAKSEIRFTANNEVSNQNWTMDTEGRFQLPGDGYISNPTLSSGDGLYDTIHLVPDNNDNDQYIIIDPTQPNHIHIRAGGTQDASSAELILGGEKAQVKVVDSSHKVYVQSWDDGNDIYHNWEFGSDGKIYGPGEDGALTLGGELLTDVTNMSIRSTGQAVVLNGELGEFLGSSDDASSQIATVGDISNAAPVETLFTVNGGSLGTQPTFNGDPLFSGSYVIHGPMVHFQVQVDMDNITSFGSGQYYVDLPFPAKYGYQFKAGCLHDISSGRQYAIGGHVYAGQSQLLLSYTDSNGQDADFDHNSPVALSTADNFHISGDYIAIFD